MQNAGLAALGLDWRYVACEVAPSQLREAIAGARAMKFVGLNLTVPHKLLACDLVDEIDPAARLWGAVNTIRFEARDAQGEWRPLTFFTQQIPDEIRAHGFNTDADAIVRSIQEDLQLTLRGACVVLLGAGGAGRTAALKLAQEGVRQLYLVNRTAEKAAAVAADIQSKYPGCQVSLGFPAHAVDLVLNATSLGLRPEDASPLNTSLFALSNTAAVYDMIYRPAETALLRSARLAGCRTANGLGMLLYQGAAALELWTGRAAPLEPMRRALHENVYGSAQPTHV